MCPSIRLLPTSAPCLEDLLEIFIAQVSVDQVVANFGTDAGLDNVATRFEVSVDQVVANFGTPTD